jgi:adenine/guanine phosphoribosyltransferase-like PRPP-binding protein
VSAGIARDRAPDLPPTSARAGWTGAWVAARLGVSVRTASSAFGPALPDLVGLAVRRNPRRAHLLVSSVLGKHVPTDPRLVYGSGALLGLLVADALTAGSLPSRPDRSRLGALLSSALDGDDDAAAALVADLPAAGRATAGPTGTVVVGFAETATALGHVVADVLGAPYLHSTRRRVPGAVPVGRFEEEHSHATSHLLLPTDPGFLATDGPLVLVDDELSTGQTALNTIVALQATFPRARYVLAALVDLRSAQDRRRMAAVAAALGVDIAVVALAAGSIDLPADILRAAASLVAGREAAAGAQSSELDAPAAQRPAAAVMGGRPPALSAWPAGVREGARHGFTPADGRQLGAAATAVAVDLAGRTTGPRILVLGHEELMFAPLRIAMELAGRVGSTDLVRFSTTTRSPILAVDEPGYAVRTALTFPAQDDPVDGARFAYNVAPGRDAAARFNDIVLVVDSQSDTPALRCPGGLLDALQGAGDRVHLVVVPAWPPAGPTGQVGDRR